MTNIHTNRAISLPFEKKDDQFVYFHKNVIEINKFNLKLKKNIQGNKRNCLI